MTELHTGFRIDTETVSEVAGQVRAMSLPDFRRDELPHMQPGMEAFDLGMYGVVCKTIGPDEASSVRAGMLVAHRTLRLSNEGRPLPQDIDAILIGLAGKIAVRPFLEPARLQNDCRKLELAYEKSPGVPLLLHTILTRSGSRCGAVFVLGFHIPMVNPGFRSEFTIAPGPVPGTSARAGARHAHRTHRH